MFIVFCTVCYGDHDNDDAFMVENFYFEGVMRKQIRKVREIFFSWIIFLWINCGFKKKISWDKENLLSFHPLVNSLITSSLREHFILFYFFFIHSIVLSFHQAVEWHGDEQWFFIHSKRQIFLASSWLVNLIKRNFACSLSIFHFLFFFLFVQRFFIQWQLLDRLWDMWWDHNCCCSIRISFRWIR